MSVDAWFRTECGCDGGAGTGSFDGTAELSPDALRALHDALTPSADGSGAPRAVGDSKHGDDTDVPSVGAFFAHSEHGGACDAGHVLGRLVAAANRAGGEGLTATAQAAANATRLTVLEVLATLAQTRDKRHVASVVAAMGSFGPRFERAMEAADGETAASYHRSMLGLLVRVTCRSGTGQTPQDVLELTNGDTAAAVQALGGVVRDVSGDVALTLACFKTLLSFADMDQFLLEHKDEEFLIGLEPFDAFSERLGVVMRSMKRHRVVEACVDALAPWLCAPPGEQLPHRVHLAVLALVKFCRAMHLFSETKTSKQALDYMLRGTEMCQRVLLPYIDACCAELKPAKGRLFGHAARVQRDKHQGLSVSVKMLIVGSFHVPSRFDFDKQCVAYTRAPADDVGESKGSDDVVDGMGIVGVLLRHPLILQRYSSLYALTMMLSSNLRVLETPVPNDVINKRVEVFRSRWFALTAQGRVSANARFTAFSWLPVNRHNATYRLLCDVVSFRMKGDTSSDDSCNDTEPDESEPDDAAPDGAGPSEVVRDSRLPTNDASETASPAASSRDASAAASARKPTPSAPPRDAPLTAAGPNAGGVAAGAGAGAGAGGGSDDGQATGVDGSGSRNNSSAHANEGKTNSLLGDLPPLPGVGSNKQSRAQKRGSGTRHSKKAARRARTRDKDKARLTSAIDAVKQQRERAIAAGAEAEFLCAIGGHVMREPVHSASSGGPTFERATIERWIQENGSVCPITGEVLTKEDLVDDDTLRRRIVAFNIRQALGKQGGATTGEQGAGSGASAGHAGGTGDDSNLDDLYSAFL